MDKKNIKDSPIEKDSKPKVRKVTSGPVRDKARTMANMVAAVGKVIQKKGYTGLTAPNIAKAAGVDKKLVWTYFGGIDNLVEVYINQKDFWKFAAKGNIENLLSQETHLGKEDINALLQSQLEVLFKDKALQKIIHWEVGERNDILRKVADKREEIGEELFSKTAVYFENSDVDLRARLALLIGGIYYLTLHSKNNGSKFCGLDLNEEQGKNRIEKAIKDLVFEAFEKELTR